MTSKNEICVVCAWRATCQKKYTISGRDMRCPDFVRDMLIQEKEREEKQEEQAEEDR
jgi:hypothetical protein